MTSTQIFQSIRAAGYTNAKIFISDADYALPKTSWLTGKFYDFYLAWRLDYNLNEWTMQNDCDNFASLFYAFAQISHSKGSRDEQGIAVGEMFYHIDADITKGHAINIAVTEQGVIALEPQSGKQMNLSDEERASCWFIRF